VNQLVGRILDRLGVPNTLVRRWTGLSRGQAKEGGAGA
jgi:3-polyprenyl-4-hydroxybenzoate decarboxylase